MDERQVIEALFEVMISSYGVQKVGAMWAGTDEATVKGVWASELAGYRDEAIKRAAKAMIDRRDDDGRRISWPPDLPTFLDLVEPIDREIRRKEALWAAQYPPEKQIEVAPEYTEEQRAKWRAMRAELYRRMGVKA